MGPTSVCRTPPHTAQATEPHHQEPEHRHSQTKVAPATAKDSKLL